MAIPESQLETWTKRPLYPSKNYSLKKFTD